MRNVEMRKTTGIMAVYLVSMGMVSIQPVVAKMDDAMPGLSRFALNLTVAMPGLTGFIGGIIAGVLIMRAKVGYKPLALAGTAMFAIGGCAPAFIQTYASLIIGRAVLGMGMGALSALGNPLVALGYMGTARTRMIGVGTFVSYAGPMVMQVLSGAFCELGFWHSFLSNGLGVLAFIGVALFLDEPEEHEKEPPSNVTRGARGHVSHHVGYVIVLLSFVVINAQCMLFDYSYIVAEIDSSAMSASLVILAFSLGQMVGGLAFIGFERALGWHTLGVGIGFIAFGVLGFAWSGTLIVMAVFMFLSGFGMCIVIPSVMLVIGKVSNPDAVAFSTSLAFGALNIMGFLTAPYISLLALFTADPMKGPILIGGGLLVISSIIGSLVVPCRLTPENPRS